VLLRAVELGRWAGLSMEWSGIVVFHYSPGNLALWAKSVPSVASCLGVVK
jgi:hypothetical protein